MRLTLILVLLLFANQVFGQNIIGLWQARDTLVSSNYVEHYVFSTGKKFVYNTSGYDGLQRIMTIGGHYNLVGNVLYLTPEYTVEKTGGTLERSRITTLNDSWSIENGQVKTHKIAKPVRQSVQFKLVKRKKGLCMMLDSWPYYQIKVSAK